LKLVVDTDVVAAALLGEEPRGAEATRLLAAASPLLAPAHWKAELANVVWKAAVVHGVAHEQCLDVLQLAEALPITSVDVAELWRGGVGRAIAARHPAYDTLFVELAVRERVPLVSYDAALRRRFPDVVRTPAALLRRSR
jgi:predicted nucleic acid-binding protein